MNMLGAGTHFVVIYLTLVLISLAGVSSASNTPGKPTNLQVSSVHDLTITLKWKRPLTTAGTTDNSSLSYTVSYTAIGSNANRITVTAETAQLTLLFRKQYNINVQAMHQKDHNIKGAWSDALKIDTKNLVPAKPTNLKLTNVRRRQSNFEITVTWEKPTTTANGMTDTSTLKYYVGYKNLENNARRQTQSSTERIILSNLKAVSRYDIQVRASKTFNVQMVGSWSDSLTLKTNESIPSKPPTNVQAVSSTPSSITVTWGPIPKDGRNGVILGYVVSYCELGACRGWSKRDTKLARSQELPGLPTGKLYLVNVAGYTKIGRGTRSQAKHVVVGGPFITTTRKATTQKPTTLPPEKTQSTSIKSTRTVTVHVDTLGNVSTEGPKTTIVFSKEPKRTTSTFSTSQTVSLEPSVSSEQASPSDPSDPSSTPVVEAVIQADEGSKDNLLNKILIIGAPAAGGVLLLTVLIIVFVLAMKRSRKRKQLHQNGGMPLKIMKSNRKRSRDMVTRGAFTVRYEPPSAQSTLGGDSMTEGLLPAANEPDQPVILVQQPNGSLPRAETDDVPLLATGYSDKCDHLRVDLNSEQSKLDEGRSSGLYDSIGSLRKIACSPDGGKSDDEERYVTQEQINATRELNSQAQAASNEGHYKTPRGVAKDVHYKRPRGEAKDVPSGNTYANMNVLDPGNMYDTLGLKDPEEPVYENTKAVPSSEEYTNMEGEYEPIPI